MKIDKIKLKDKLDKINITDLATYLDMHRTNVYYHIKNLKKGKLTFKIDIIKKISMFISDRDDIFFVN